MAENPDLKKAYDALIEMMAQLHQAYLNTNDQAQMNAILTEEREVNHRMTLVYEQLFVQGTQEISQAAKGLDRSIAKAKKASQKIQSISDFVTGISQFLSVVDKLVDAAKVVI